MLVVAFCAFPCRLLKIREENLVQVDICVHVGMGGLLVFFWNFQFFVSTSFILPYYDIVILIKKKCKTLRLPGEMLHNTTQLVCLRTDGEILSVLGKSSNWQGEIFFECKFQQLRILV